MADDDSVGEERMYSLKARGLTVPKYEPVDPKDPLALVAQACYPKLLSLDDLLAARCVCRAWHNTFSTRYCKTWRLPQSLWQSVDLNAQTHTTIRDAAGAYAHALNLMLDTGTGRPSVPMQMWAPLLQQLRRWLIAGGPGAEKRIQMHLRNPPSPSQLIAFKKLSYLHSLRIQHSYSAVYSRHLVCLADLTQLHELCLNMEMPRMELRSIAHQRLRRAPVTADFLSTLVNLRRLELTCRTNAGEPLSDTLIRFSQPSILARFSYLTHLTIAELALPGPSPVEDWLKPFRYLECLQLSLQDTPAQIASASRFLAAGGQTTTCSAGGTHIVNPGRLGGGGLTAAIAAAALSANSTRADQQLAVAQQNLLAGLQNLSSALQQAANTGTPSGRTGGTAAGSSSHHADAHHTSHQLSPAGPSASSSAGGAAPAAAAAAAAGGGAGGHLARSSTSTSANGADAQHGPHGAAAAAEPVPAEAAKPQLPIKLLNVCPRLRNIGFSNLYDDRFVQFTIPNGLTRLSLQLAMPHPGNVTGEQLASLVQQAADSLLSLELGLGMRSSLSGTVMRGLKRNLKRLRELTLIEGAQDHLEGLGCWCNLPKLTLVEGRCTVPLRGLYELSMRAAMGRTPGVLRYHGHTRHIEELASRLGPALQELRLDSLTGLGTGYRSNAAGGSSSCSDSGNDSGDGSGSGPSSPTADAAAAQQQAAADAGEGGSSSGIDSGGEGEEGPEAIPLPALAQLSSMTRLEVVGDLIGQLDACGVMVLSSCKQLRVLHIEGREAWLAPELGVKEQLDWLGQLPQLRLLKLSGVMLGRSRLSGKPAAAPAAAAAAAVDVAPVATPFRDTQASSSSSSSSSSAGTQASSSNSAGKSAAPAGSSGGGSSTAGPTADASAVKGLGNGLGSGLPAFKGLATFTAGTHIRELTLDKHIKITPFRGPLPAGVAFGSTAAVAAPVRRRPVIKDRAARAAALAKARLDEAQDTPEYTAAFALLAQMANLQLQDMTVKAITGKLPASAAELHREQLKAAQQDADAAVCIEEVRRWLCQLLPNCRVWLD